MKVYDGIMQGLGEAAIYSELYVELVQLSNLLLPYYDIDKVKYYAVYVWSKGELDESSNVFDITADGIDLLDRNHIISEEAMPIIDAIQAKLREMQCFFM